METTGQVASIIHSIDTNSLSSDTVLGKIVGSMCAVCGVLVMALPIPIVVDNFANYYSEQKKLEAQELKKEAMEKEMRFRASMRTTEIEGLLDNIADNVQSDDADIGHKMENGKNQLGF